MNSLVHNEIVVHSIKDVWLKLKQLTLFTIYFWLYLLIQEHNKDYKTATKITGRDAVLQLLECCDDQLRKDLTRSSVGSLTEKTEDDVLTAMQSLAVREENIMVARVISCESTNFYPFYQGKILPLRPYLSPKKLRTKKIW